MGISIQHLLVVLVIVILIFGTKRLKNIGADLGDAIKGFRHAVKEGEDSKNLSVKEEDILEGEITHKDNDKV